MLRASPLWRAFEAEDERRGYASSYEEALQRFAALWAYARAVRPDVGRDWEEDVRSSVAVARAVNDLAAAG